MKQKERIRMLLDALIIQTVDYGFNYDEGYNFMTGLDDFINFNLDDPHIAQKKSLITAWDEFTDKDYTTIINKYSRWYLKQLEERK